MFKVDIYQHQNHVGEYLVIQCIVNIQNVVRLAIHLPDEQIVCFNEDQDLSKIKNKMIETTLTMWFDKIKLIFKLKIYYNLTFRIRIKTIDQKEKENNKQILFDLKCDKYKKGICLNILIYLKFLSIQKGKKNLVITLRSVRRVVPKMTLKICHYLH